MFMTLTKDILLQTVGQRENSDNKYKKKKKKKKKKKIYPDKIIPIMQNFLLRKTLEIVGTSVLSGLGEYPDKPRFSVHNT